MTSYAIAPCQYLIWGGILTFYCPWCCTWGTGFILLIFSWGCFQEVLTFKLYILPSSISLNSTTVWWSELGLWRTSLDGDRAVLSTTSKSVFRGWHWRLIFSLYCHDKCVGIMIFLCKHSYQHSNKYCSSLFKLLDLKWRSVGPSSRYSASSQ